MQILDAQVHIGPGGIAEALAAMDALGISRVLIDEYWLGSARMGDPAHPLANGVLRPIQPTAQLAALTHPDRFAYLVRLERVDPEATTLIRLARDAAHARALRVTPGVFPGEARAFAEGGYDAICAAACDAGLPLFVFAPDQARDFARCAEKFPKLRLIVDHCGLVSPAMRQALGGDATAIDPAAQLAAFEAVLALADHPNVALKWAHAPAMFRAPAYPGEGLWPILRRAVDRFGAERVMWASDASANQTGESWAELLFGVRGAAVLSPAEREAVLGGTARAWLDWPA